MKFTAFCFAYLLVATQLSAGCSAPGSAGDSGSPAKVRYQTIQVDGLNVFYREAGPKHAPVIDQSLDAGGVFQCQPKTDRAAVVLHEKIPPSRWPAG
jgi:hypothetical protein